jgi:hypothetical protein
LPPFSSFLFFFAVFNQLRLLSLPWKGWQLSWQCQLLAASSNLKQMSQDGGNFSTISSFSLFLSTVPSDITFHWSSVCPLCYKLVGSSFDKFLKLTARISSKLTERISSTPTEGISSNLHTTQTSRTALGWQRLKSKAVREVWVVWRFEEIPSVGVEEILSVSFEEILAVSFKNLSKLDPTNL